MSPEVTDVSEPRPPAMSHVALFLRFLRFGALAFGGPVAQIAMLRHELIEREGWMSSARFNRLLAVMQVLPGPEAHELCVHLGMRAKGRLGGVLAGLGFMLPGLVLMLGLAWLYFRINLESPAIAGALLAVQAAVIGLILNAIQRIGRHVLTDAWLLGVGVAAGVATLLGVSFWIILPAAGLVHALIGAGRSGLAVGVAGVAVAVAVGMGLAAPSFAVAPGGAADVTGPGAASLAIVFVSGLKAGLLTFGGAYTAIPFIREDIAGRGWMSDGQFLDGVALSGVLPAPLIIFATFVGYVAGGFGGALAMTAGVFLPAFAFSLIFYERLEAVLENRPLRRILDGVAAGVVGLIAAATIQIALGMAAETGSASRLAVVAGLLMVSAAVAWRWRSPVATPAIITAAGVVGVILLQP